MIIFTLSNHLLLPQYCDHLVADPFPQHQLLLFPILLASDLFLDGRRTDLRQIHFHYLAILWQFLVQEVVALAIEHYEGIFLKQLLPAAPEMQGVQDVSSEDEVKLSILVFSLEFSE